MVYFNIDSFDNSKMTDLDFNRLSTFIYTNYGIKLPPSKKIMLEGRLLKRLRTLNIPSYKKYCEFIFSNEGQRSELIHMIDVVTTNKTDFFRESVHFDYLSNNILPEVFRDYSSAKPFKVWSAGCSTGEEPYTLAMVLSLFAETHMGFSFNIWGTDISSRVLQAAALAVYTEDKVAPVPIALKRQFLLKSKDVHNKTVRIVPHLREKVKFGRLNFIDEDFGPIANFNVIFCRNVLIYFDRPTQEKVILKLCSKLEPGGYLFLGHSESVSNMNLPLTQIRPNIFKRK